MNTAITSTNNNEPDIQKSEIEIQFKKKQKDLDFVIQPNPNNGKFILTIETTNIELNAEVVIYNLLGKIIYSNKITSITNNLDFSNLSKGIYYIQLRNNDKTVVQKFIIQ